MRFPDFVPSRPGVGLLVDATAFVLAVAVLFGLVSLGSPLPHDATPLYPSFPITSGLKQASRDLFDFNLSGV